MGTVFGREGQQVLAVERDAAFGHFVLGVANEDMAQRALARTIGAHEHMDFSVAYGEIDAAKDFLAFNGCVQVSYF